MSKENPTPYEIQTGQYPRPKPTATTPPTPTPPPAGTPTHNFGSPGSPQPAVNPPVDPNQPAPQNATLDQVVDQIVGQFKDTPYANIPALRDYAKHFIKTNGSGQPVTADGKILQMGQTPVGMKGEDLNATRLAGIADGLKRYVNTFDLMFKDKVGRDPTADEFGTYFDQVIMPDKPWQTSTSVLDMGERTKSALSDFFTSSAQQEATKKISDLSQSALAPGSAFDQWQQAYRGSIDTVQNSLLDYQSRLMEKIRPQLLTSLQSQGLLNTGALNEAFAGQANDFASGTANYVSGLRGQAEQDIAAQKYGIQSDPINYKLNNAYASVPNMIIAGQGALTNLWNQNTMSQNFNNQMGLLNYQNTLENQNRPSLLQQAGGMILGGAAGGVGQGIGQRLVR